MESLSIWRLEIQGTSQKVFKMDRIYQVIYDIAKCEHARIVACANILCPTLLFIYFEEP